MTKASSSIPGFCPSSRKDWRQWLRKNHKSTRSVWLELYKKKTNIPSLSWSDAVDEALCFGWIDGKRIAVSEESFKQFFSKRNPKSGWSKINKEKVKQLIRKKLMTSAGHEAIRISKTNGSWTKLDDAENFRIPADLERAFNKATAAKKGFLLMPQSTRKVLLMKLTFSKRPETRKKRIAEILVLSKQKIAWHG